MMQHSRFALSDQFVLPSSAGAETPRAGFIPFPLFLWAGLTWEQIAWQQWAYQQAWQQAQAALQAKLPVVQTFKVTLADIPPSWRN